MNWSSNVEIQHRDSNIDWENLHASVYNTGSPFSSDNPTWGGYRNEQKEQQYTERHNDAVPDRKFHIEVYGGLVFFSSLNSVTTFSTDTERVSIHYAISIKVLVHWKLFLPKEPIV